jgi:hypothetical protein
MLKGSLIERAACKFRALIGSYRRRIATKIYNSVQNSCGLNACIPESSGDRQALLREFIHTDKAFNSATAAKRIYDKIHRPGQVRCTRAQSRSRSITSPLRRRLRFTLKPLR